MLVYDIKYLEDTHYNGNIEKIWYTENGVYFVEIKTIIPTNNCCQLPQINRKIKFIDVDGGEWDVDTTTLIILKAYDDITGEDYTEFYQTHPITIRESR